MVVWWSVFAYMIIISGIGMMIYKGSRDTSVGLIDESPSEQYKSIGLFMALMTFVLLVFFSGQRSWIFDTTEYQYTYTHGYEGNISEIRDVISGTNQAKSPLYSISLILFKWITHGTYNDWFTLIALVQCVGLVLLFYKYSVNFTFSVFLFFSSSCFLWIVNGMRQFLAVTIVLFFFEWILKRKTIKFFVLIFILYFLHSSVILWIPVYFIVNYKPWSKKFVLFTAVLLIALLYLSKSSVLQDTDYSYVNSADTGVNPLRVIVMSVPAILSFIYRERLKLLDDNTYNTIINISIICSGCFIVGMFTNGFVARLAVYFQIFNYLALPWIFKNLINKDLSRILTICCIIGFMLYFCYDMYVTHNGIYLSENLKIFS